MEEPREQTETAEQAGQAAPEAQEGAKKQLFRQESLARISSPDQLNDYLRVANVSVFAIIAAVVLLLASLLVWSAYGTLPTTIAETGVVKGGELVCYNADASDVAPGQEVRIGSKIVGTVKSVSDTPLSSNEVASKYDDDYTLHILGVEDWNYEIRIDVPDVADGLTEATIITGRVKPITFIFN